MIQFLSTPTDGASLANIFKLLNSQQIKKLTTGIQTDYLGDLSRRWSNAYLEKIPSYCAYETLNTYYFFRVVSYESATHLCDRVFNAIEANHFDIAKPKDINSPPYTIFKSNYMDVFEHPTHQRDPTLDALVVNRPGGTISSFNFSHNIVSGIPTIVDNQDHIGSESFDHNVISAIPQPETKCSLRLPSTLLKNNNIDHLSVDSDTVSHTNDGPTVIMQNNTYFHVRDNRPFLISNILTFRDYDGTFKSHFIFQMDRRFDCDYLIIALRGQDLINFLVSSDQQAVIIDQVSIAGFIVKKIVKPAGILTLQIEHKSIPAHFEIKTWWK